MSLSGGLSGSLGGVTLVLGGDGGTAAGSNGEIQYNSNGEFGANSLFTLNTTNNRLSVYGSLGSELLTNGNFTGSATGWTVGSGFAYSANAVSHTSNGTAALSQSCGIQSNRTYRLVFTISAWTVGTVTPTVGGVTSTAVGANGTYTVDITTGNSATTSVQFTPSNTSRFTIDTVSCKQLSGGEVRTGGLALDFSQSNGSPGTTRAISLNNAGAYTYIDANFSGTTKGALGFDSGGGVNLYQTGGNGVSFYSGTTSPSLYSYNYQSYFYHSANISAGGYGQFAASVGAGTGAFTTPTSTLQTAGSMAMKVKRVTATGNIDSSATHWLLDATSAAACSGSPTYACSHWTNSTDCALRNNHGGGCSWFAGNDCSAFNNEYGMGTCSGTSGCSAQTGNCSGSDESSCLSGDDSYGGSCAWNGNDCSSFDEATCGSYSGSGCTQNYADCSGFNGNESGCSGQSGCSVSSGNNCPSQSDESSCTGAGCSWDGMSCTGDNSTCTGSYFSSCSGTYYTCTGTYFTGSCTGTYGAACSGTSTCNGINNSTDCGNEAGCSWSSVLNVTLPDGETCPDRTYWFMNDASGGADSIIYPYAGQTVDGTTSYTLAAYKDWVHLAYFKKTQDCSIYVSAGTCTPSGCTANYSNCSWDSMGGTCSGNAVCVGIGDQTTCESTTYFSSCTGTEVLAKNWYKFGS